MEAGCERSQPYPGQAAQREQAKRRNRQVRRCVQQSRITAQGVSEQGRQASANHVEAAALPATALTAHPRIAVGHRTTDERSRRVARPEAGLLQVQRVLQVLHACESVPGHRIQRLAAEQHSVAHQVHGQSERGPAAEPYAMEQQERGLEQAGLRGRLLDQDQILGLHDIGALGEVVCQPSEQLGVGDRVGIDDHHRVDGWLIGEKPVDPPAQSVALAGGQRVVPLQHVGPGPAGGGGGVVCAVVSDHGDAVVGARVGLLEQ